MTLVEVLVSVAILAMVSTMIWTAFTQTHRTTRIIGEVQDVHHAGRLAMSRIARDLSNAFLTRNNPPEQGRLDLPMSLFMGEDRHPFDRLDFRAFGHRRLYRDADESDQMEVSYFVAPDPKDGRIDNLVRRESPRIDAEPLEGGNHLVLLQDVVEFDVTYFDRTQLQWIDFWSTTELQGQPDRLPEQVRVVLAFRDTDPEEERIIRLSEKVTIALTTPLAGRPR